MMTITRIADIDNKKHIAILDTSSISFMQGLEATEVVDNNLFLDLVQDASVHIIF